MPKKPENSCEFDQNKGTVTIRSPQGTALMLGINIRDVTDPSRKNLDGTGPNSVVDRALAKLGIPTFDAIILEDKPGTLFRGDAIVPGGDGKPVGEVIVAVQDRDTVRCEAKGVAPALGPRL